MALYAASKAANANFAQSAALELASAGIRVNVVAPGLVDTDMSRPVMPPEALGPSATPGVPQVGRPRDIAAAIVHLVSDDSPFTTGTVFNVDGGYLAGHARLNPTPLSSEI